MSFEVSPDYNFNSPIEYTSGASSKWNIFPDSVLTDLNYSGCDSTINGFCSNPKNIEECIEECQNSKIGSCSMGWFIETPERNICAPLFSHASKSARPYYRLRNKSIYPKLKDMKAYVFTEKNEIPFPPNMPNLVYYEDNLILKNVNTGLLAGVDSDNNLTENVVFSNSPINIQLLSGEIIRDKIERYIPVKNGDEIIFNIPHTAFLLRKNDDNNTISWLLRASNFVKNDSSNTFNIYCKNKKIGEYLNYQDRFYFTFNNYPVVYDKDSNSLMVSNESLENSNYDNDDILYEFIPQVYVYYCDSGAGVDSEAYCKQIPLADCDRDGFTAKYKGSVISRNPTCWKMCQKPTASLSSNKTIGKHLKKTVILALILLALTALTVYILYRLA